jgi:hypothetical protein
LRRWRTKKCARELIFVGDGPSHVIIWRVMTTNGHPHP